MAAQDDSFSFFPLVSSLCTLLVSLDDTMVLVSHAHSTLSFSALLLLFLSAPWKAQADSRGDDALGGSWTDYHEIKWEHPVPKHHQRHARRALGKAWAGTSTLSSAGNSGVGAM